MARVEILPESLAERYKLVRQRIENAARKAGRVGSDILLVAVSKHADPEQIRELLSLGHTDLGENRVQHLLHQAAIVEEYLQRLHVLPTGRKTTEHTESILSTFKGFDKRPSVAGNRGPIRWHMIGHLQRNKARKVMEYVRLVHSVDSLRIAEELQQIALRRDQIIDVLVQVNCSGEASKFGCPVPAALPLAEQIATMVNIRVRGLMTMAPIEGGLDEARRTFARCRELFDELKTAGVGDGACNLLSMGMSDDFEVAIEEGANVVRVGTAIFGEPKGTVLADQVEEPEPEEDGEALADDED